MSLIDPVVKRPVILTFIDRYLPGYKAGGPIRSIANMVEGLGDEYDFRVVASDRDLGDAGPYRDIVVDGWNRCGKASVFYRSPGRAGWRALMDDLETTDFDLIYLNSFFSTGASLRPLAYRRLGRLTGRPVLIAPRGEFSVGALAIKSIKKRLFIALARALGLYRGVTFQASSDHEAADIRRTLGATSTEIVVASNVFVASNPSVTPNAMDDIWPARRSDEPLRAVFLSRISPMKNLAGALDMLARVSCPVDFSIYGIIEDAEYWTQCQQRIAALPSHIAAQYLGEVKPDQVYGTLSEHDLFFLPTLGENFGHVISEALSAGVPVLISDRTPWKDMSVKGVGANLPLEYPSAFIDWIDNFAQLTPENHLAMRTAARGIVNDPVEAKLRREANRVMLNSVIMSGKPGWV